MARALLPSTLPELRAAYMQIGRYVGLVCAIAAFAVSWAFFIDRLGWLVGGGLGWWPSMLIAGAAAGIGILFWGPITLMLAAMGLGHILGLGP